MSKVIKKLVKIAGILIVGVVILGVVYKGTALVKRHYEQQRINNMYTSLKETGRLRIGKHRYVYLTDYGQQQLQTDMSFKDSKKKAATAYVVDQTRQVTYDYVSQLTLPKTVKKGTVLALTAPFGVTHSADLQLNLLAGTSDEVRYKDANISLPAKHNKKDKKLNIILGYNVDKKGDLIIDTPDLAANAGQKITYELQNQLLRSGSFKKKDFRKLSKTPNINLPLSWLNKHTITAGFKTSKKQTAPKIKYQATIDGQKVTIPAPEITLKKVKAFEKDWRVTFKLDAKTKTKLAQSKSKRLKITAAYYGTSVDSYYYAGNDLSGLYEYHKK
ncbi:hypothetical protein ACFQ5M_00105 [Agrilactobacillus yilanensis]|uniref:Cell surface protein n=1 Tax=Agrilactobacillus yilanensis TaxID=2485997 RepID=A0ABW4J693_9LACO|nr:hypothetical protein [Agrilactobacillus yilanensis]